MPRARVEYRPGLLAQQQVRQRVVLEDGQALPVDPPRTGPLVTQPSHVEPVVDGAGDGPVWLPD